MPAPPAGGPAGGSTVHSKFVLAKSKTTQIPVTLSYLDDYATLGYRCYPLKCYRETWGRQCLEGRLRPHGQREQHRNVGFLH